MLTLCADLEHVRFHVSHIFIFNPVLCSGGCFTILYFSVSFPYYIPLIPMSHSGTACHSLCTPPHDICVAVDDFPASVELLFLPVYVTNIKSPQLKHTWTHMYPHMHAHTPHAHAHSHSHAHTHTHIHTHISKQSHLQEVEPGRLLFHTIWFLSPIAWVPWQAPQVQVSPQQELLEAFYTVEVDQKWGQTN